VVETIEGVDFAAAMGKSEAPANVEWKIVSKPVYATNARMKGISSDVWTLVGVTDSKVWVLSLAYRLENSFMDHDRGGRVIVKSSWQTNSLSAPLGKSLVKVLPAMIRSVNAMFEDGTSADAPKKWLVWEGGRPTEPVLRKIRSGSGGATLKDVLLSTGLVDGDAAGMAGRKSAVEMIPLYSKEREQRVRKENAGRAYTWQCFDFELRINGKSALLSDDTIKNLDKAGFIMSVFSYDPKDKIPKQLHKLKGSFFKANAGVAMRIVADALTSEPSWVHIAMEKAAEEYENEDPKTKAASTGFADAEVLFGSDLYDLIYW
jgi:hypothetical protein